MNSYKTKDDNLQTVVVKMTAKQIINKEYKGKKNFMTPEVLSYGNISNNVAYEISTGRGFDNEKIYGLSIVKLNDDGSTKRMTDHSGCFSSMYEVDKRIENLKDMGILL